MPRSQQVLLFVGVFRSATACVGVETFGTQTSSVVTVQGERRYLWRAVAGAAVLRGSSVGRVPGAYVVNCR